MKAFSSGQLAALLGIHRDKVNSEIKVGAPSGSVMVGTNRGFTESDVAKFYDWCKTRKIKVKKPALLATTGQPMNAAPSTM